METTRLTKEIIKSRSATEMLRLVADKYGDSYVGLHWFNVIGLEIDRIRDFAESVKLQTVPQTATWGLPNWERSLGLEMELDWTVDTERRQAEAADAKWNRKPMPPDKLASLVSRKLDGADVKIVERTGKNQFSVYVDVLRHSVDERVVRDTLDRYKPSHLVYVLIYTQTMESDMNFGARYVPTFNRFVVPAAPINDEERGFN